LDVSQFDSPGGRRLARDVETVYRHAQRCNKVPTREHLNGLRDALAEVGWWSWRRYRKELDELQVAVDDAKRRQLKRIFRRAGHRIADDIQYRHTLSEYDLSLLESPVPGPLTDSEHKALAKYMKPGGSTAVNRALRRQTPMSHGAYLHAVYLLRALARLPDVTRGTPAVSQVWRGTSYFPGGLASAAGLAVGQIYQDEAFLSSSEMRTGIIPGQYVMRIEKPSYGRNVSGYGKSDTNALEREILFPPRTKFRYLGLDSRTTEYVFTSHQNYRYD
jgi:hypothetical protein